MAEGQGFASLSKERRKQVAKAGNVRAQQLKVLHRWTPEQAKAASAKGAATRKQNHVRKAVLKLLKAGVPKETVYAMEDNAILKTAKSVTATASLIPKEK
jgi:hypothetical protein